MKSYFPEGPASLCRVSMGFSYNVMWLEVAWRYFVFIQLHFHPDSSIETPHRVVLNVIVWRYSSLCLCVQLTLLPLLSHGLCPFYMHMYPCIFVCGAPVVPWGETPLPQHTHHPGGHQAGSARWQGHHREAAGQEALSHHLPTGPGHGSRDWWGCVWNVHEWIRFVWRFNHLLAFEKWDQV